MEDEESRIQCQALETNVSEFGIPYFGIQDKRQGIVHVIGPEQGLTLPGTTIVCGDSHTATHGAFGALAFGIGTSEVEHVLATQTLRVERSKNMRVRIEGLLGPGISSKDVILYVIGTVGASGGTGTVIEYCGNAIRAMSMESRMALCNMSIEAGARAGMVAPDETTVQYVQGKPFAPRGEVWEQAKNYWKRLFSDKDCVFDIDIFINADEIQPTVSWGTSPQDVVAICDSVPDPESFRSEARKQAAHRSLAYMNLVSGVPMTDIAIDNVFIGSCTNSRLEDLKAAAEILKGRKISKEIKRALVVPGSGLVKEAAEKIGLHRIFIDAGFEWREAGCSMCVGLNSDTQAPGDRCASTSNRNFETRQGPGVRTHIMSPVMAAAAAITGKLSDFRLFANSAQNRLALLPILDPASDAVVAEDDIDPLDLPFFYIEAEKSSLETRRMEKKIAPQLTKLPFNVLRGVAAPLDGSNIDTDMIFPKQFCKTTKRTGLGQALFYHLRYNKDGSERKDFVLNRAAYRDAKVLVVNGENFGCGSSREHAPWALADFGITCIIARSFADIFYNNCFKNGMLPIIMSNKQFLDTVLREAEAENDLEVDLLNQRISKTDGKVLGSFEIDELRKKSLVHRIDDIQSALNMQDEIQQYERMRTLDMPWLTIQRKQEETLDMASRNVIGKPGSSLAATQRLLDLEW